MFPPVDLFSFFLGFSSIFLLIGIVATIIFIINVVKIATKGDNTNDG